MPDDEETRGSSPEEGAAEEPEAQAMKASAGPDGGRGPGLWRIGEPSRTTVAAKRAAEREQSEAPAPPADPAVAQAAPRPGPVVHRRTFLLGGFWVAAAGLLAAIAGGLGLDFLWIKKISGFGAAVDVAAARIPAPGADPVRIVEGGWWVRRPASGGAEW